MNYQSNGTHVPEYHKKAKNLLNNYLFRSNIEAKYWRMLSFILLPLLIAAFMWIIHQSTQTKIVPYIVEVTENGSVRQVGKIETDIPYKPDIASIKYFLAAFIKNIRILPQDEIILRQNFINAYSFVTNKGENILTDFAKEYDPLSKMKKVSVSVSILNIIQRSDMTFQVSWKEDIFSLSGNRSGADTYTGIFNVVIKKPDNEKALKANPLGVYFDFFEITKELEQ